jgi:hypothetical protein
MPDVLQCPYCDLRFPTRSDLEQHQAFDHPRAQEAPERPASPPPEPAQAVGAEEPPAPKGRGLLSRIFKGR